MSDARVYGELVPLLDDATYLGPAAVVSVSAGPPRVCLADGREVPARLALAFPYRPVVGDELLIIARSDQCFVIGVLEAHGELTLEFPGDVHLRATDGDLHLDAAKGIELEGSELQVRVRKLRVVADVVEHSAREMIQRIRDVWSVRAGSKDEVVAGDHSTRAKSASVTTEDTVNVNGRAVHLG